MGEERGSALVIALVFLVLTGVLVAALVSESLPSFVTTRVVKDLQDSAAAADAGVEFGIQTLRTDSTLCAGPSAAPLNLPALAAVNGHAVTVTCQTNQGYAAGALGWGLITNDPSAASITGTGTGAMSIVGPVFNAGGWTLAHATTARGGYVYTRGAGCGNPTTNLTVTPTSPATFTPFTQQCTPARPVPVPAHLLPTVVPGMAAAALAASGSCTRTLLPGHYTTAPVLTGTVQMASGIYYFDNVGSLTVGTALFGGQFGSDNKYTGGPCAGDPVGSDGSGVEIILGGNSTITLGAGSTMELYTRVPATNDGSTPGISIFQVPAGSPAGWTVSSLSAATKFLNMTTTGVNGFVRGAIYGPGGSISLTATNTSNPVLGGGADVWDLTLQSSLGSAAPMSSIAATTGARYTTIVSVSAGLANQKNITSTAVVRTLNDGPRTVQIVSWRTQQDS